MCCGIDWPFAMAMKHDTKSEDWIWPPAGKWLGWDWAIMLMAILGMTGSCLLSFFSGLTGTSWIWFYFIAMIFGASGVALIFWAKLPLYRLGRFFTFGAAALPVERRSFYRWGFCFAIFSVALLACLLLSEP
jgi:hypothetical protein